LIIDEIVLLFALWLATKILLSIFEEGAAKFLFGLIVYIGFPAYLIVSTALYQRTLGKKLLGLKIVSSNEEEVSWKKAFLRELLGKILSGLVLEVGFIMIGFTKKKQGLHDYIAGTYVIKEK
jgi:uncharacterized RDD family membrane protein YckC